MISFADYCRHRVLEERTLYHGTVIDNEDSIKTFGLAAGMGDEKSFVNTSYDEYPPEDDDDGVVFLADKKELGKAINAMVHNIGSKLNKNFHSVTDIDIRNHGLLVVVPDEENSIEQAPEDLWSASRTYPRGVEPRDYFTDLVHGTKFIKGSALVRFLRRYNALPRTWGPDTPQRMNQIRGRTAQIGLAQDVLKGWTKPEFLQKIQKMPDEEIKRIWRQKES